MSRKSGQKCQRRAGLGYFWPRLDSFFQYRVQRTTRQLCILFRHPLLSRAEFDSRWPTRHRYLFPILFFGFLFSPCVRVCVRVCSLCTHRVAGIWGRSSNRRMIDASLGDGRRENWSWPDLQVLRLFDRGFNFGRVRFLDFAIRFFNRLRNLLASKFESWKLVERDDESTGSDYFKFSKYDDFLNFGRKYESIWRGWKFIRGFKFSSVAIRWRWHSIASKFWNRGGMEIKIKYPSQQYHVQSDISKNIYIFTRTSLQNTSYSYSFTFTSHFDYPNIDFIQNPNHFQIFINPKKKKKKSLHRINIPRIQPI